MTMPTEIENYLKNFWSLNPDEQADFFNKLSDSLWDIRVADDNWPDRFLALERINESKVMNDVTTMFFSELNTFISWR